jgi:hypothetical protein
MKFLLMEFLRTLGKGIIGQFMITPGMENSNGSTGIVVQPEVTSLRIVGLTPTQWTGQHLLVSAELTTPLQHCWSTS